MAWDIISQKLQNADELSRDSNGTIDYDQKLERILENLLNDKELSSITYENYMDYDYSANKAYYCFKTCPDPMNVNFTQSESIPSSQYNAWTFNFNEMNASAPTIPQVEYHSFLKLPTRKIPKYRYINDVLTKEDVKNWRTGDSVFLSAGTGRGKNTFIKKELLKYCQSDQIVIFENRESLLSQQILDLIKEIDSDALKYQDIQNENMVILGTRRNIMLISYQKAANNCLFMEQKFLNFCIGAKYLVFDEIHFILDDAAFNKGISFFVNQFLQQNCFPNAIKLFLSGSMEEVFVYLQKLHTIQYGYRNIIEEKQKEKSELEKWAYENSINRSSCHVLHMPTDYSYVIPYIYRDLSDIELAIENCNPSEKWLIFVNSKEKGEKLWLHLREMLGDKEKNFVKFLHAENKKSQENKEFYENLIRNEKFDCRILIATTVIYNGVNLKDKDLKHIVLPFCTVPVMRQLIGRRRIQDGEMVQVYFPKVLQGEVKKRFRQNIREYFEIMFLQLNPIYRSIGPLNGMSKDYVLKYVYLSFDWSKQYFIPSIHVPAMEKLHFDTMFYLFILQRMQSADEKVFPKIMLQHLDIADKFSAAKDITTWSESEKFEQVRVEVKNLLEQIERNPICDSGKNGEYFLIAAFEEKINIAYRKIYDEDIDTHWKDPTRTIPNKKLEEFVNQLHLPYEVKIKKERGSDTKTVSVCKEEKV